MKTPNCSKLTGGMLNLDQVAPERCILQKAVVWGGRAVGGESDGAGSTQLVQQSPELLANRLRSRQSVESVLKTQRDSYISVCEKDK